MEIKDVKYLFSLPSMKSSFFVAGEEGQNRIIKRIDILETPAPEVNQYLEKNEFIFTSFWNSKDNKYARINLVKSMIEQGCAGIGIMPHFYLNDKIDDEIIQLGNQFNFPIIYVNETVRWSDIIQEFYENKTDKFYDNFDFSLMVDSLSELKDKKDIGAFCNHFSEALKMPITIQINSDHYESSQMTKEERQILNEYRKCFSCPDSAVIQHLFFPSQRDDMFLRCANKDVAVNGYVSIHDLSQLQLRCFVDMAELLIKKISPTVINSRQGIKKESEQEHYLVALTGDFNINAINQINEIGTVMNYDSNAKYMILLVGESTILSSNKTCYSYFCMVKRTLSAKAMVFTERACTIDEAYSLDTFFKTNLRQLGCLQGCFTIEEFILQSLILHVPYQLIQRIKILSASSFPLEQFDDVFLDTYRIYLIVHNLADVASLLDIHVNTVKYRINKIENEMVHGAGSKIQLSLLVPIEFKVLKEII